VAEFACFYCRKAVDVTSRNAALHRVARAWQHIDCCARAIYSSGGFAQKRASIPSDPPVPSIDTTPMPKRVRRCSSGGIKYPG